MAASKPPPRTLQPDDERKVQLFLERAAPIVLENRVLDNQKWRCLVALAEELGLTDEQLRGTVDDLRQRGVIERIDLSPPKPPPLPTRSPPPAAEPEPAGEQEVEFSLTPPPPPPRATEPRNLPANRTVIQRFLDKAAAIVAEQRGAGPKAQVLIAAAAKELGLTDEQANEALGSLQHDEGDERAGAIKRSHRWRVEGEPEPEPPPSVRKPHEVFSDYVRRSLAQVFDEVLSTELEKNLVAHGKTVLRLTPVFARHLLLEAAEKRGIRVASVEKEQQSAGDETTGREEADDPKIRRFLDGAAPILSQHRGINAKSRVLLNALARELELSDAMVEQAIESLQRESVKDNRIDSRQRERIESFRGFLREGLAKLPRRILTASAMERLAEHGQQYHGVAEDWVRPTIREVAVELQVSVVSQEQALQHVESLVAEKMGQSTQLDPDVRSRIYSEGNQWGLSAAQIEQLIRQRSRLNERRRRSERHVSNLALVAACIAVLLVLTFLAWTILSGYLPQAGYPAPTEPTATAKPLPPRPDKDDSWWDADLSIAVANARIEFPLLRKTLSDIAATGAADRAAAYERLVSALLDEADDDLHRGLLSEVLSRCYALEPEEESADHLSSVLLKVVPRPEDRLNEDATVYPKVFWAMRVAAASLAHATSSETRAEKLAAAMGRAVGVAIDKDQPLPQLERQCLGALAERLYRLLISAAAAQPLAVGALHAVISTEAARYLDQSMRAKLNADFLVAVLTVTAEAWTRYEALIRETIDSPDPLTVLKFVELYQRTANRELQSFLAVLLLRRAGAPVESRTVAEIADEVRRALGITDDGPADGRGAKFSRRANQALSHVGAAPDQQERILNEIVGLAHLATLGCALAQGELGLATFDQLYEKGPPRLATLSERATAADDDPFSPMTGQLDPGTERLVDQWLRVITNPRNSPASRTSGLERLASIAGRVPDLPPDRANALGSYLLAAKSEDEQRRAVEQVKSLAHWTYLRLALADRWDEAGLRPDQLGQLLSHVLGKNVEVASGELGEERARAQLLRSVLAELAPRAVPWTGDVRLYDEARDALLELYRTQAKLMGGAAADYQDATAPSQVLRKLIDHYAAKLQGGTSGAAVKKGLARLPHELTAVEYLATDDLQRTVLLERIWLRLLAIGVSQRDPDQTAGANSLVAGLRESDGRLTHVLSQLRNDQVAMLRMWLLWNKPK